MYILYSVTLFTSLVQAVTLSTAPVEKRAPPSPTCSAVAAKPLPAGALCGVKGSLKYRNVIFRSKITSAANPLHACRDLCLEHPACLSFAYKASEDLCRAFGSTLRTQGIHDMSISNGNTFYSRSCFKTQCDPPSASCIPAALDSPIALTGYSDGTSDNNYGPTESVNVPIPFEIGYGVYKSSRAIMHMQGYLQTDNGPNPNYYWAPFYSDMQINYGKDQGLFYEVSGKAPNRTVKFEWRTTNWDASGAYGVQNYDSVLQLFEADDNAATFSYLKVSDDGSSAAAGVRDGASGALTTYSLYQPGKLVSGLTLHVDNYDQTFVVDNVALCDT